MEQKTKDTVKRIGKAIIQRLRKLGDDLAKPETQERLAAFGERAGKAGSGILGIKK